MQTITFSSLEATFLSKLNEGFKTFDSLLDNVPFNEKTLSNIIESLIAKNVIKFNTSNNEYYYEKTVTGDVIILDGNIMLPVSIITTKTKILITRGPWYEFPLDFDIRRIIWNVQLPNGQKSTLVDLIQNSIMKTKKTKILQLPEYQQLVNKLIPYNENIKLHINVVGEDVTEVDILLLINFKEQDSDTYVEFRMFRVKTEIKTDELIEQLRKSADERNFEDIQLNKIFEFNDFIFNGNSIPYTRKNNVIEYVTINSGRKKIELVYYQNNNGKITKLNSEEFIDLNEGVDKIKTLFDGYATKLLMELNFLLETDD